MKQPEVITKLDSFFLQHKLYPWLVPMYRTVHRKIPRTLIFRAIRWVNPERFFPLMAKSADDFANMNDEEIKKAVIELNEYRKESLAISNRYDQMISLIERGQLPYRIMWPEQKWMTMADRLDRAERLKKGTAIWEKAIDKKALEIRRVMLTKGIRLEDVKEIWDPIPAFKDPKKKYRPLRVRKEPGTKPIASEVEDRGEKFRLPAPEEYREGEEQLGHREHEGHEVAVSLGEYVARGPITVKGETPDKIFPGWDSTVQEARESREDMGLIPEENWSHGQKRWNTAEITGVFSSPEESDEPTPRKARSVIFRDEIPDGGPEKAVFITPERPERIRAAKIAYLVDRAFDLKVTPRIAEKTIGDQEGYLAEQVSGVDEIDMSDEQWTDVLANSRTRESLYGISLLDVITGHSDRHGGNIKYDPSHRAFFATNNEDAFEGGTKMEFLRGGVSPTMEIRQFPGEVEQYREEIENYFDKHYSNDRAIGIIEKYELDFNNLRQKSETLKGAFTRNMMNTISKGV